MTQASDRAAGHLHQGVGLGGLGHVGDAQSVQLPGAGRAVLHREVQAGQALHILVIGGLAGGQDHHLAVVAVGLGHRRAAGHLIGDGHAVPDGVHPFGVQLHQLVVPVDLQKLHLDPQVLRKGFGHVGVKADPLAVFVPVVHGAKSVMPTTRVPLSWT